MKLNFEKLRGIVPVVVQDFTHGDVLMLGFMNAEAVARTRECGEMVFFSRSRNQLWRKGERSGHRLRLRELLVDCDSDSLLARVEVLGAGVCHEGYRSCFYRRVEAGGEAAPIAARKFDPRRVYRGENQR